MVFMHSSSKLVGESYVLPQRKAKWTSMKQTMLEDRTRDILRDFSCYS